MFSQANVNSHTDSLKLLHYPATVNKFFLNIYIKLARQLTFTLNLTEYPTNISFLLFPATTTF